MKSEKKFYLGKTNCVILTVMVISSVFLMLYPFYGIDVMYWLYRIDAIADSVQSYGIFSLPLRITENTFWNYGYGAPLFYGDFMLLLPSLFVAAGMPLVKGYSLLTLEIWLGRFLLTYFAARYFLKKMQIKHLGNENSAAMIFAAVYQFFPYMIECLLFRGAIGEAAASMVLPLIAASFYVLIYSENVTIKDALLLAAGMSVVVCSHVLSTGIICGALAVFALFHLKAVCRKKTILYLLLAIAVTIVLTAYWSLPFLEQMLQEYITVGGVAGESSLYKSRVGLTELLIPNFVYSFYYIYKFGEDMGIVSFWPSCYIYVWLLAVLLCILSKEKWKESVSKRLTAYAGVMILFMSCGPLLRLADKISVLRVLQFPWRLLLIVSLFLAIGLTYYYLKTKKKSVKILIIIGVAGCAFISGAKPAYVAATSAGELIASALERQDISLYADSLYYPDGADKAAINERGEQVISSNSSLEYTWNREAGEIIIQYANCNEETTLELPLLYYYGYSAVDEANGCELSVWKSEQGLVNVTFGENTEGVITVSYAGTPVQQIASWISLLGWIAVLGFIAFAVKLW